MASLVLRQLAVLSVAMLAPLAALAQGAAVPAEVAAYAGSTYGDQVSTMSVFRGDFSGDGADDAVAVIGYVPPGGNAIFLDVSLFETVQGELVHRRQLDEKLGGFPTDAVIRPGEIEFTVVFLQPGEPRCCPTGQRQVRIKP